MLDEMDVKILEILQKDCTRPVADVGKARNDALRGHPDKPDLECPATTCVGQGAVGADAFGCLREGVNQHLAANAMRAGDAAKQNALRCSGHGPSEFKQKNFLSLL